jgi:hypothetical protein
MNRTILDGIIKQYYLDINEVSKWKVKPDTKTLLIGASAPNQVLSLTVKVDNFTDLTEPVEFAFSDTPKLLKMINVLGEDVKISLNRDDTNERIIGVVFSDEKTEAQYVTTDLRILTDSKAIKIFSGPYPEFDVEMNVDLDFISTYISAKGALSESEYVVFGNNSKTGKLEMVFGTVAGNTKSLNTSKIKYALTAQAGKDKLPDSIGFNAAYIKSLLAANKKFDTAELKISSSSSFAVFTFKNQNISATYNIKGIAGK